MIAHLEKHYHQHHTIAELAKMAHLSRSGFHEAFQHTTPSRSGVGKADYVLTITRYTQV